MDVKDFGHCLRGQQLVGRKTFCKLIYRFFSRTLLQKFPVTGETQERERILLQFSKRYHECNGQLYGSEGKGNYLFLSEKRFVDDCELRLVCQAKEPSKSSCQEI